MNDLALTQLKFLVEQAVRPVRASAVHKQRMREELLAHVCAVFEEEAARLGDDRTALERTVERFGNTDDLAAQLQESISWTGYIGGMANHLGVQLAGGIMVTRNRLYNAMLIIEIGALGVLMGLPADACSTLFLPDWSTPFDVVVNGFYLVAMSVALISRLTHPALGKHLTMVMNLLLLIGPPFVAALGIYGLSEVDRNLEKPLGSEERRLTS